MQFVRSAPGLRHLCKDYWFLQSKEQFQYNSEFVDNNVLLEDEALLCCLSDQEQQNLDANDSIDESISDEMDIYNGVNNIKHRERNMSSCSSNDEDVDMEFFCDHF